MAKFVGVERPCEVCGTVFRSPRSHAHVRTCSTACGYKIRKHPWEKSKVQLTCAGCGKVFTEHECHAERRKYCSHDCQFTDPANLARMSTNLVGEKNPAWKGGKTAFSISKTGRKYGRVPRDVELAKAAQRRARKMQATPAWADGDAILAFYAESNRLSIETGTVHHVDHIVPLTSKTVCGLHCEFNLQVLPGVENLRKHNRHWPDKPE